MYNQVTDRYRFVEVKVIAAPPVLGRMISSVEGYSLQLFRSKEYVRSLRPHNPKSGPVSRTRPKSVQKPQQMKVYNGDVIYQIDMHPHSIPIVGSFKTKDNYVRIYDIILDLVVDDPVLFAKGYSVGKDPVNLAIEAFRNDLQKYAEGHEHDKLTTMRQTGYEWNYGLSNGTGMRIHQIRQWTLREDPKRVETSEIEQDAEKNTLLVRMQADTKKLEEQFDRERSAWQHMYQLHSQLSNTAAQELKAILQERIRDTFESGKPISEVAEETLKLLNVLYKGIGDFTFSNGTSAATYGADGSDRGASSTTSSVSGTSTGTQGTSPGVSGTVPGTRGTSFEDAPTIGGTMPALNELMRKEQEDAGN